MNFPQGGAVIYAKDHRRLAAFYEGVAGLRVSGEARDHVVLESGPIQLVALRTPDRIARTISIASPPERRENVAIKPVFFVDSLALARTAAARFGGALNGAEREWPFEGVTVCDGCDPEGNVFQLRQR